jgi:shikimate 5-dehydrogenase
MDEIKPLVRPTFYFIGVSTGYSKIMGLFPRWISALGFSQIEIRGYDIEVRGPAERYRAIVRHIKEPGMAVGALVTTHKIDIVRNAGDLFDAFDPYARVFGEISVIAKRDGRLEGYAKDPVSSGLALEAFLPSGYWIDNPGAQVLIMGAGGSGLALSAYLMKTEHGRNVPAKIAISNRRAGPLEHARRVHDSLGRRTEVAYVMVDQGAGNDALIAVLPPGSLVVNATGMGKDRPGSPLSDGALFPENGYAWDFNYRGSLEFLGQAARQDGRRNLHVEDGWTYFIHGWSQAIMEALHIDLSAGEIETLSGIAADLR